MHFYIDHNQLPTTQDSADAFGPLSSSQFNITNRFELLAEAKAYACLDSMMIVQQSDVAGGNYVNVILKPIEGLKIPFSSVKYYVYRGILRSSFFSGNAIKDSQVPSKSFLERFWEDAAGYNAKVTQPNQTTPNPKSFGYDYDNTLADSVEIEKIYDNSQIGIRAVFVKEGEWIGDFDSDYNGFEIIMNSENLNLNLEFLRAEDNTIEIPGSGLSELEERAARELILSYIDPAAFFGLHYDSGVYISVFSNGNKTLEKKTQDDIYTLLLDKFENKNRVYLDIRSEKGYSYNFYQNYNDGSDYNIKIGNSLNTPAEENYTTDDWPIVFISASITTTSNYNDIKIKLRIDDNTKPILFFENTKLLGTNNRSRFIDEKGILDGNSTDWSKDMNFFFPNTGTGSSKNNIAYYIKLNYQRQEYNPASPDTIWLNENYFDNLFGYLSPKIFDTSNAFGWIPFEDDIIIEGKLPQITDVFVNMGTSGCSFDSDSVVFYIESKSSYKTSNQPYPQLTASIVFENPFFINKGANNLVVNYDLFLDPNTNEEITAINIDKYKSIPFYKENLFFIIISKNEYDELNTLTGFSTISNLKRFISFVQITDSSNVDYLTDLNGNKFYKYKLKVSGLDSSGIYHEEYPSNDIYVYSADGLAFASLSVVQAKITKGPAWTHQYEWNDTITNQSHIANFGTDYYAGMKYKNGLQFRIKSILERRLTNSQTRNTKIDCADLCLSALIEYASFYGLPILLEDFRETTSNRVLNSKHTQYKSVTKFDIAARQTYGAATLFSPLNKFIEDVDWNSIHPSDVMTWRSNTIVIIHPHETFHANTITELTNNSITVIQGSLEDEQPTPIEKRIYDRNTDGSVDPGFWKTWFVYGGSGAIKARRWKFNVFDNA